MTTPAPQRRPSPLTVVALVVSLLSLLVAVGSTSYAAGLSRGSVGTAQLRAGAVTTPKIATGAVTGVKVRDRSIGRTDLAPGLVAPRPTYVRRSVEVGAAPVRLATVNGVAYDVRCQASGPEGTIAVLDVAAVAGETSGLQLTATYVAVRRDAGSSTPEVTSAGATDPFTGLQLLAFAGGAGAGRSTLTGVLQALDQPAARVDLGLSGTGGSTRYCRFTALVAPLG